MIGIATLATKRRTQAERTAASDAAMFKAAIKLIASEGPSSMTLTKICKESGFSGGLVSYRFGSKRNLLIATADRILELWQKRVIEPANLDSDTLEGLEMVVRLYFKAVRSRSDLMMAQFRLMNVSYSSYPELQPAFQDYDKKLRANIVEHIDRARSRGDVKAEADAHTFAIMLMGMLRGIAMQSFVDPKAVDLNKAEQSAIDIIESVLRA